MELLGVGAARPALIIGMPVGFVGAAEAKQALWETARELDVEVITLLGRQGGSATASATVNALGQMQRGLFF
jgi:precorrin-8X/cobalt-precorrin-8 methylmutase